MAWIKKYIFFHGKRHPDEMGSLQVQEFLSSLASKGRISASTQNQAFSALLFLYREVLGREIALVDVVRAKRLPRVPLVLTRDEVAAILRHLEGPQWLMASLMYGSGLRLLECLRLRVKDLDLVRGEITVRDGKGGKDRVTLLPGTLTEPITAHLARVHRRHEVNRPGFLGDLVSWEDGVYGTSKSVFFGGAGARRPDGGGAPGSSRIGVGRVPVDCTEARLYGRDATQVGAPGAA